jgi:hypothetical protein
MKSRATFAVDLCSETTRNQGLCYASKKLTSVPAIVFNDSSIYKLLIVYGSPRPTAVFYFFKMLYLDKL